MGKKEKKMRSFAGRLTWRIVLMMLIIMGLVAWLIYGATSEFVLGADGMRQEVFRDGYVSEMRRNISDIYTSTYNHVPEIEENLANPDRLPALVERVVRLNPQVRSCGISFIADYYPQKGHWYCPYAVRTDSSHVETKIIGGPSHDYLSAGWFKEGMEAAKTFWSKPFFDGTDSVAPLVSCLFPIHDRTGRTVAVLGSDMSLEWLAKKMRWTDWETFSQEWVSPSREVVEKYQNNDLDFDGEKLSKYKPYSFLINSDGTYLVHPDRQRIINKNIYDDVKATPDTADDYVVRQMVAGKKGYYGQQIDEMPEAVSFDGKPMYVFYAPVKFTDWSLALAVPKTSLDKISIFVGLVLLLFIAIGLLAAFLVSRVVIRRAVKPLKQLALSADEVAKGNFSTSLPVIRHHDEVGVLRDSFDGMQQSLTKYVEELKHTTASKAAIENELQVAHDIQMGMLPKIFPPYPERSDIEVFGSLNPAKEVGGDLFDFYIRDNQLFFCIGDVSGKGVPASLVMAVTRSLFRNISAHTAKPHHIISALNEALAEGNDTSMFVTSFVGVLDLTTGMLRYCNAGHDAPMLIGRGVGLLPCDPNLPLGVMAGWEFTVQEADIDPQTIIFLYTDGLTEAENADHALFGEERVTAIAQQLLAEGKNTPEEIIFHMKEEIQTFVDGASQSDDQTMLAIKYLSPTLPRGEGAL